MKASEKKIKDYFQKQKHSLQYQYTKEIITGKKNNAKDYLKIY